MKSILTLALCIVTLNFVSACVNIKEYPSDWEPRATSISNIEEMIVGDFECPSYASYDILKSFNIEIPVETGCDTVIFRRIKAGELEVTALKDCTTLGTSTLIAGEDYIKSKGWLAFPWGGGFIMEGPVVGAVEGTYSFTQNMSGDLIVKASGVGAMVIGVFPLAGYSSRWIILERKNKEEPCSNGSGSR